MKAIEKLKNIFKRKDPNPGPLLIIRKEAEDSHIKEYNSIEEAIADLENDPNVPSDKIEKIKSSLKKLKSSSSIKIKNGEIM